MNEAEQNELTRYWMPMARMAENISRTIDDDWEIVAPYTILNERYTGPIDWPPNWRDEVERPEVVFAGRAQAGQRCPREGWWLTPAKEGKRYFQQGEVMPDVGGDYGLTIWQWCDPQ